MRTYVREGRLVTVENLSLQYGDKVILRDINLSIDNIRRPGMQQGQVIALIGPSGIGKTQLFRCIAGLQRPTVGSVTLNGGAQRVHPGEVGVVFQNYPLLPHRTIESNLRLAAQALNRADQIPGYLQAFDLADKAKHYPSQLSGGQRQRVAIMQQLLSSLHFVLMDEPFSGLDIVNKRKVVELIAQVSTIHEDNTLIVTTHDLELAISVADTVWALGREAGKPGATIIKQVDLIERSIAWAPNVERHPNFYSTLQELKDLFTHL